MHCKDVSMRDVGITLDEDSIASLMEDWTAYVRTDDLILRNGDGYAALHLEKEPGTGLFRKVTGYEILSLPDETVYVEAPDMDVLNVVYLSYALLLIQFIFTTGTTYRFPAKHDDAQHRFTKELQRCLPGIDQPAMGHEVRIGSRIIHIILFVVTLGLYSIPLLLLANHGMNKHIRNQWKYETDLMMKIIRNEGGIGVEGFGSNQPSNAFLRFLKNAL